MCKLISPVLFALILLIPAAAQPQQSAPPSFTGFLKDTFHNNRSEIARSAEKFPEEFYGLRPGPQTEVRTFGQLVGHLANFNYLWCSQAKNEKNPMEGKDFEKLTSKADLTKALNDAVVTHFDSMIFLALRNTRKSSDVSLLGSMENTCNTKPRSSNTHPILASLGESVLTIAVGLEDIPLGHSCPIPTLCPGPGMAVNIALFPTHKEIVPSLSVTKRKFVEDA